MYVVFMSEAFAYCRVYCSFSKCAKCSLFSDVCNFIVQYVCHVQCVSFFSVPSSVSLTDVCCPAPGSEKKLCSALFKPEMPQRWGCAPALQDLPTWLATACSEKQGRACWQGQNTQIWRRWDSEIIYRLPLLKMSVLRGRKRKYCLSVCFSWHLDRQFRLSKKLLLCPTRCLL